MDIKRIKNMKAVIRPWFIHLEIIKIKGKTKKNSSLTMRMIMNKENIIKEIKEKDDRI